MTTAGSFLGRLVELLDDSGAPYMVAGSFASTYHGVPRTTQDIDIVVELTPTSLKRLLARLPDDDYYVSEGAAADAVRRRGQFNVIDLETGWKADLIVRKQRAFSLEEFGRRQPAELEGVPVFLATAEDTVLAKLEWSKASGSERQLRDVAGVLRVAGDQLDNEYLERWAGVLEVEEQLARARALDAAAI